MPAAFNSIDVNVDTGDPAGLLPFPSSLWPNYSGVPFSAEKELARPQNVVEVDGYRERWVLDGDHEVSRVFLVPWSIQKTFVDWALGYSTSGGAVDSSPLSKAQQVAQGAISPNQAPVGTISRVPPSQFPMAPWLYATECFLEEPIGVPLKRIDVSTNSQPSPGWDTSFDNFQGVIINVNNDPLVVAAQAAVDAILADPAHTSLALAVAMQALANARSQAIVNAGNSAGRFPVSMIRYGRQNPDASQRGFVDGFARYRVVYRPLPYAVRSDADMAALASTKGELERWIYRRRTYSLKTFQLLVDATDPNVLKFITGSLGFQFGVPAVTPPGVTNNNVVPGQGAIQYVPLQEWTYTWYQVPDIPEAAIDACLGKVNDLAFDGALGFVVRAPGTMLFVGTDPDRAPRNVRGRIMHKINYKFIYNPYGWNLLPDSRGGFWPVGFGGNAARQLYPSADFTTLFTQPSPQRYYQQAGFG